MKEKGWLLLAGPGIELRFCRSKLMERTGQATEEILFDEGFGTS
jgi:hypothetical protein